jgi:hypothetical protein
MGTDVERDDYESLDTEDLQKTAVYRFFSQARYYTACRNIVRELVSLRHSGNPLTITIETVPFSENTSTPEKEGEYRGLNNFFNDRLRRPEEDGFKEDQLAAR